MRDPVGCETNLHFFEWNLLTPIKKEVCSVCYKFDLHCRQSVTLTFSFRPGWYPSNGSGHHHGRRGDIETSTDSSTGRCVDGRHRRHL